MQRLILFALIMGFAIGFLGIMLWGRQPEYGLLFGDLERKEASEIIAYLKDNNIHYKIKSKGSAIVVPSEKVYEVRLDLAKNNLPRGESGFELFDEVKFGMSKLAQKVNYRRAIQGELSKTISHLDGVEWAKVQIVIPEHSLYIEEDKPSTASVILKTRSGRRLALSQVAGITHLVSASVEGLIPENVTITDSTGNLLSKTEESSLAGMVTSQLEFKNKIENYYSTKALNILENITGAGKAVVKVSADIDFKHVDEKQILYDQDNQVPINQTISSQSSEVPQSGQDGQFGKSRESEETETTQYALSKTERVVSDHVAKIRRLNVAVLVDGTYVEEENEEGVVNVKYVQKTQEELDQIAAIVKRSIGIDETPPRNDKLEIQNVQFYVQDPVTIDEGTLIEEKRNEFILTVVKNGSLIIAVIAFLLFAVRALKKLSVPSAVGYGKVDQSLVLPEDAFEMDSTIDRKRKEVMDKKRVILRDGIIGETKGDPRTTSNLIRKWLREVD